MREITTAPIVSEIKMLHAEIVTGLRMTLSKATRIGELLTQQKAVIGHGGFEAWVNTELGFTSRTARNYMRVFRDKALLKTESVSDLNGAYRALIEHKADSDLVPEPGKSLMLAWEGHADEFLFVEPSELEDFCFLTHLSMGEDENQGFIEGFKRPVRKDALETFARRMTPFYLDQAWRISFVADWNMHGLL